MKTYLTLRYEYRDHGRVIVRVPRYRVIGNESTFIKRADLDKLINSGLAKPVKSAYEEQIQWFVDSLHMYSSLELLALIRETALQFKKRAFEVFYDLVNTARNAKRI